MRQMITKLKDVRQFAKFIRRSGFRILRTLKDKIFIFRSQLSSAEDAPAGSSR